MENNNTSQSGSKMNPMVVVGIIVAILVVVAVVILGKNSSSKTQDTMMTGEESTETHDEAMMEGDSMKDTSTGSGSAMEDKMEDTAMMKEGAIEVEGGSFYYKPNEIRAKVGEPMTIKLNAVDMMHDIVIDEFDVKSATIKAGESTTVTFTPDKKGEFEFYCSVGNHRAQGMVGTLIVE